MTHPALDATRQGVIDGMAAEGYVEGENIEFDYQTSEGDMTLVASIAQKFVSDQVDAIVSIATPDSQASVKAAKGTGIPVIPMGTPLMIFMSSGPAMMYPALQPVQAKVLEKLLLMMVLSFIPGREAMVMCFFPSQTNSQ